MVLIFGLRISLTTPGIIAKKITQVVGLQSQAISTVYLGSSSPQSAIHKNNSAAAVQQRGPPIGQGTATAVAVQQSRSHVLVLDLATKPTWYGTPLYGAQNAERQVHKNFRTRKAAFKLRATYSPNSILKPTLFIKSPTWGGEGGVYTKTKRDKNEKNMFE